MSNPRFQEILRCNGVDQDATPHPGMIVPLGGENQVLLETFGMDVAVQPSGLKVMEFDGRELTAEMLKSIQTALSKPDVDPQQRDAFLPDIGWQKPRFFRIRGTSATGFPGTSVHVFARSNRGARIASARANVHHRSCRRSRSC